MGIKKDLEQFDALMEDMELMINDLDERDRRTVEHSQKKLLQSIPEWREYQQESRKNGKKARHNKKFFKKNLSNEYKIEYKKQRRMQRIQRKQAITNPDDNNLLTKIKRWLSS